jgi:hypothetical protein
MALEDPTKLHRNGTRRRMTGIDGGGRSYTINADGVIEFPRGRRAAAPLDVAVPLFEPEVRDRICRTVCANFGFGALGTLTAPSPR